ncbi:DNA (cytosine-5)-methyltransferase 3A-like isoform X2 [Daphnia pulicaria]|uniref:DNA (cytosine-5)-methyltransferase 3A-like isoform X2 n=1 Tax=Daphnia pulicaria TaxID=35523 RepID=UPI001EECDD00|nr:DNA (cytosine-5)-methyltransferase 3A-like isoform X2 [Daphnia pulicaria]
MAGLGGPALAFNRDQTKLVKGTADKLKAWAIKLLASSKSTKSRDVVLDEFPKWLQRSMDRIKDTNTKLKRIANEKKEYRLSLFQGSNNMKLKKKKNSGADDFTYGPRDCDIAVVDRIKAGTLDMDYFCLGCHVEIMGPCMEHPLFFGSLCNRECKNELLATSYSIGEDDIHVSCAICGSTGNCLVCENSSCSRVFCSYCVELLVGEGSMSVIMQKTPWFCFLCASFTAESHGLLHPRSDWAMKLRSFLHQDLPVQLNRHLSKKGQPALRVVVLHDNLGAVNYALNSLRLELDQYWAYDRWNEVYELNGVEFAVLKNANRMKDEEWAKLCPVHLLVSCLPAKKFDPKRHQPAGREVGRRQFSEGEYGEAFFDFYHVKNCIERNNEETPLLWAVENVACYHIIISRFLQMEPITFDMKDAQGSTKHRLVWTNIPEQNFNPQLEQVINNDHSSISCLPLSREPFFIKYPWILEDIVAINQPLPANWQEKHDRMLFQRDTRSKMKTIKAPAYLEHYSVVQLTQKTAKKKRKLSSDLRPCWKLRQAVGSADENSDGISDETGHFIAALTDHATYARSLGFPEPFPQYVSHLEEAEVQERLNRSLPVSLWIHIFQPLLKLARVVGPK